MPAKLKPASKRRGANNSGQHHARSKRNGQIRIHVASPLTASEIRKVLGIRQIHMENALRAIKEAGIKLSEG
jgi:DNA-binding transcriptional regulator GbsR (MarR family)